MVFERWLKERDGQGEKKVCRRTRTSKIGNMIPIFPF
jgi:hypothetical protein